MKRPLPHCVALLAAVLVTGCRERALDEQQYLSGSERPVFLFETPAPSGRPAALRLRGGCALLLAPGAPFDLAACYNSGLRSVSSGEIVLERAWFLHGGSIERAERALYRLHGRAPQDPGVYTLTLPRPDRRGEVEDAMRILVLEPAEPLLRNPAYAYPPSAGAEVKEAVRRHAESYQPPAFLLRMEPAVAALEVLPGYTLNEWVCHTQKDGTESAPFATLSPALLEKVQRFNDELARRGLSKTGARLLSGFRTPKYNIEVEGTRYSRHIYGDAADLIVDDNGDGRMDDINRDGVLDRKDGIALARVAEDLEVAGSVEIGGIGIYELEPKNPRGVSLHLDTRGFRARWGFSYLSGQEVEFSW